MRAKLGLNLGPLTIVVWTMLAGSAFAQATIFGSDTRQILEAARSYGSAALESLPNGDPKISGRIDGMGYALYFMNCTDNTDCRDLNFYTAFADVKPSLETINQWNREKRFGRAYLDTDLDAAVEMDVSIEHGVTRSNLETNFSIWRLILNQYTDFLGL